MELLGPDGPADDAGWHAADVGDFEQGSGPTRWALARYLVGRAVAESISRSLALLGLSLVALAVLVGWAARSPWWAVAIGLVALGVLVMRALLRVVLDRLTAVDQVGPLRDRLRGLIADTRGDVLVELRRIGLPGRTVTLPWFAVLLARRRTRPETISRLRRFDLDRAVTPARIDELHMVLRAALARPDRLQW
jgi:hypothetical protein